VSRSGGIIWLPVVVLAAAAALAFVKPWQRLGPGSTPALPALLQATVPAPQTTPTRGPKMSATRLAAMLDNASSRAIVAAPLHWHCTTDLHDTWDYVCSQAQLREVRGYDVSTSQITQSTALVYAGRKLGP